MKNHHPAVTLLLALEDSVALLANHVRQGLPLPTASFLANRRRSVGMLRAVLRYVDAPLPEMTGRRAAECDTESSTEALLQCERHLARLYRIALRHTASDAVEYRLLAEQLAGIESILRRFEAPEDIPALFPLMAGRREQTLG